MKIMRSVSFSARTARGFSAMAAVAVLWLGTPGTALNAATLAYWRFEGDGVQTPADGVQVEDTNGRNLGVTFPNPPGIAVPDSSGNGNTLRAWDHSFAGHVYRPDVPATPLGSGLSNSFSVQNAGSFPALYTWSLKNAPTLDV